MPKPITVAHALRCLLVFNEKAEEIRSLSFPGKIFAEDAGGTIHFDSERGVIQQTKQGADKEATAAFALTLRFFFQPRDGIQLEQVESIYQEMPLPTEYKDLVTNGLKILNDFLDSAGDVALAVNGNNITHRMILETFLYGHFAHVNEDKRKVFEMWRAGPVMLYLESTFEYVAGEVIGFIFWLAAMNSKAVEILKSLPPQ